VAACGEMTTFLKAFFFQKGFISEGRFDFSSPGFSLDTNFFKN